MPSLSTSSSSSARSGDATQGYASDSSGFNVNFGNGVSQGGGKSVVPDFVWYSAIGMAGLLLWKRYK